VLHQGAFFFSFAVYFGKLNLPIARSRLCVGALLQPDCYFRCSMLILLCEQVRMCMKQHSFWRETMKMKCVFCSLESPHPFCIVRTNSRLSAPEVVVVASAPSQDQEMVCFDVGRSTLQLNLLLANTGPAQPHAAADVQPGLLRLLPLSLRSDADLPQPLPARAESALDALRRPPLGGRSMHLL
jgi:hypothetical protein